jgi:hypothetical protein
MCTTASAYGQLRLAIADQIIEGALLHRALEHHTAGSLGEFCESIQLKYDDAAKFVELVDDTFTLMIQNELNINYGGDLSRDNTTFMKQIAAMKHCIYDGFSSNLFILRDTDRTYAKALNPRVVIKVPDLLADNRGAREESAKTGAAIQILPKYIIASGLTITAVFGVYVLSAKNISVLDGYLSPDIHYGY